MTIMQQKQRTAEEEMARMKQEYERRIAHMHQENQKKIDVIIIITRTVISTTHGDPRTMDRAFERAREAWVSDPGLQGGVRFCLPCW